MPKTLLVEDNATFRQMTKDMLLARFPSMSVVEAANGNEALKEVNCDCPELILMDIKLPGKNGLELTREIKSQRPHVVVIILTSYDFPEYRDAANESGADYFLEKGSAKSNEIVALIDSIITERSMS
jgi:two-component system nitrate/nitrite response regulator NarL